MPSRKIGRDGDGILVWMVEGAPLVPAGFSCVRCYGQFMGGELYTRHGGPVCVECWRLKEGGEVVVNPRYAAPEPGQQ